MVVVESEASGKTESACCDCCSLSSASIIAAVVRVAELGEVRLRDEVIESVRCDTM